MIIHFKKAGWLLGAAILFGCNSNKKSTSETENETLVSVADSLKKDTFFLKETSGEEDTTNIGLSSAVLPVKANFKRINSIGKWTNIVHKDLENSPEEGEAVFYYSNGLLEKITSRYYGETSQGLTEYYLLNGAISFVFEKTMKYNRPVYYDSAAMNANNDNQFFDIKKSELNEIRSYFAGGKLIQQLNNLNSVTKSTAGLLAEQKRIMNDFADLRKME
jgi:hypothetical protein